MAITSAPTAEEIHNMWKERKDHRGKLINRMHDVHQMYNDEWLVPLPEMDKEERPAVANLLALGVDQTAMRIASVTPQLTSPALSTTQISQDRAASRVKSAYGIWDMNGNKRKTRRRARHLVAYGSSPVRISPVSLSNDPRHIPFIHPINPMCAFPKNMFDPDCIEPDDCIIESRHPISWLEKNYPRETDMLRKGIKREGGYSVLEYQSYDWIIMVAVGAPANESVQPGGPAAHSAVPDGPYPSIILGKPIPNRMGICPIVMPGRITLDEHARGQFLSMIGMYQRQAKTDALLDIAIVKAIFVEKWLEAFPNMPPPVIEEMANPKRGIIGKLKNGRIVPIHIDPGQMGFQREDMLERAQRLTAGIPAEFGGESPTNVRTARRGEMVLGSQVDMGIQEYQELFEASYEAEIRREIKCLKVYWGSTPTMFVLPGSGKVTRPDYIPNDIFTETDEVRVSYPAPGADASGMIVQNLQKLGAKAISKQTMMEQDPSIKDVPLEIARIQIEGMQDAALAALEAGAQNGSISPMMLAKVIALASDAKIPIQQAILDAHDQEQKRQAAEAQQQQPQQQGAPPQPGQQPGIMEQPPQGEPSVGPPDQGQMNLAQVLQNAHPPAGAMSGA